MSPDVNEAAASTAVEDKFYSDMPVDAGTLAPAQAEAAPAAETTSSPALDKPEEPEKDKPWRSVAAENRIREQTRRIAELETALKAKETPPAEPATHADGPPDPETFTGTAAEFKVAVHAYIEKANAAAVEKWRDSEAKRVASEGWEKLVEAAEKRHPDVREAIFTPEGKVRAEGLSTPMDHFIADSDIGPDLLYHFANHPKDLARIAKLGPAACSQEMVALQSSIKAQFQVPHVTKAPKAPADVGGRGPSVPAKLPLEERLYKN